MKKLRHIALLAFDGVQVLDITGPAAVFGAANDAPGGPHYRLHIVSPHGGAVASNCGVALVTAAICDVESQIMDTVLVAGGSGDGLRALAQDEAARAWMVRAAARARRYGSVCSGTFVLAHFGIIQGKRVATHWEGSTLLGRHYPDLQVDANALYVEDGRVWTSAGVTTGIDMCLALVARDLGEPVANEIAQRLVLYARRPGYQSQFSPMLAAQARADTAFSGLIEWIRAHLAESLDVERLAERAGMSPRSFHRRFLEATGETPGRFIETLRLDHARQLLQTRASLKEIAARSGYATQGQFSKAFARRFGLNPGLFREMHAANPD
ncbi:HTH-type transcriptional regulator CdhR [Massilia sp. Bi118]|uniref:GlxA family transcriptional regulator n=1 Tax=Massilia sp. Bi118 TaxID=2822346 RepID=UPI001DBDCAFD|nr:helix-turn-helix domain-containing protein [Massilia sp. Bi118]CAH0308781.1 HTH-type transcriptional regulator CdhR [Massilia sp. Bi118]